MNTQLDVIHSVVKMPLMHLPVSTPIVRFKDRVLLISPGSQLTIEQLKNIGTVTDIIAPNLLHSAGVEKARQIYPQAKLWAVRGLKKTKPQIPWTDDFNEQSWPYHEYLQLIELKGMPKVNEVVFYEPQSQTLITTDLGFNMQNVSGVGAWLIQSIFGTYRRFAVSRLFTLMIKKTDQFQLSIEKIFDTKFNKIMMSHGEPLVEDARRKLAVALKERGFHYEKWN